MIELRLKDQIEVIKTVQRLQSIVNRHNYQQSLRKNKGTGSQSYLGGPYALSKSDRERAAEDISLEELELA